MRRRKMAVLGVALLAMATVLATPVPAWALGDCNVVQQIFVFGNSARDNTNGGTNRIYLQNRTIDSNCKGSAISTSNSSKGLSSSSDWGNWVEIGWDKYRDSGGSLHLCWFRELGVDFSYVPVYACSVSDLDYAEYDRWRVRNPSGTTNWEVWTDLNDDGTFVREYTYSTTWGHAWSMGETERKGNDTGMVDEHRALQYFNNTGTWVDWPDAICDYDNTNAYEWNEISSTRYLVEANTNDVCD